MILQGHLQQPFDKGWDDQLYFLHGTAIEYPALECGRGRSAEVCEVKLGDGSKVRTGVLGWRSSGLPWMWITWVFGGRQEEERSSMFQHLCTTQCSPV